MVAQLTTQIAADAQSSPPAQLRVASTLAMAIAFGALYYTAAKLGLALRFPGAALAALWPPNALLLAALLLTSPRRWWIPLLAIVPAHLAAHANVDFPFWWLAWQIAYNWILTICCAWAVRRLVGARNPFDTLRDLSFYLSAAVFAIPAFIAWLAPAPLLALLDRAATPSTWLAWRSSYLANALGFLTLTPALVLWASKGADWLRRGRLAQYAEAASIGVAIYVVFALIFPLAGTSHAAAALYALMAPLLWAAARFGVGGAASVLFSIALASTVFAMHGTGMFAASVVVRDVVGLQAFLLAVSLPLLILAVLIDERARDADALRESALALRQGEERLRLALKAGRMGVWDWDTQRNTLQWSPDHFLIMGYAPFSVTPTYETWARRVHPEDLPRAQAVMREAMANASDYLCEYRVVHPDGAVRWAEARAAPIYDANGECVRVMGLMVDVTERKRTHQALMESEERYRTVVENQTELVCRYLPDTTLTFVNEAYCRFFGQSRRALVGRKFLELIPASSWESVRRHIERLGREKGSVTYEHEVLLPDRSLRWQQWVDSAIQAPDGSVVEFQAIGRDITDLRKAQDSLRRSDERFQLVLRATDDVIFDWDMKAHRVWWSANGERLFGIWSDEARPDIPWWAEQIHADDRARVRSDLQATIDRGEDLWEAEYRLARGEGSNIHINERGFILRDASGQPLRMIGSLMDITDRKRLEAANRTLARAARLAIVGEITASIAHEINQPLAAILSNADAALLLLGSSSGSPEELRNILDDIRGDDLRASQVISRLRALLQDHELEHQPVSMNELAAGVVRLVRAEAKRRRVSLETRFCPLPTLYGDHHHLQQVLLNLLLNGMDAMANAPEAARRIIVTTEMRGADAIRVRVSDAGCGIPETLLPRLFDSFFTTKANGMGLGLSIARSIIEAHGGRIWAENHSDGPGATLQFELPVSARAPANAPRPNQPASRAHPTL
jgi:PAS domain S-box-containing protein